MNTNSRINESRLMSRRAALRTVIATAAGLTVPIAGCQVAIPILYKLLIIIAKDIAAPLIIAYVGKKLEEWAFDKADNRNSGGDVVADSEDGLTGKYTGKMEIAVQDEATGKISKLEIMKPKMTRRSKSAEWKLDPTIVQQAKLRAQESFE